MDICNDLEIKYETFIKAFYALWKVSHEEEIKSFISDLTKSILGENEDRQLIKRQYACNV